MKHCEMCHVQHLPEDCQIKSFRDKVAALTSSNRRLVEALEGMLECSSCKNKCDPNDMTCATNKARKAIAENSVAGEKP